jgi:hypothetical protein
LGRPGAYKSEKRRKELSRLKKQEEKRQRRLSKADVQGAEKTEGEVIENSGSDQNTQQQP